MMTPINLSTYGALPKPSKQYLDEYLDYGFINHYCMDTLLLLLSLLRMQLTIPSQQ